MDHFAPVSPKVGPKSRGIRSFLAHPRERRDPTQSNNVYGPGARMIAGLDFLGTYSSCGASGLNFSLVLTSVELVLKSGLLKETKHIIQ